MNFLNQGWDRLVGCTPRGSSNPRPGPRGGGVSGAGAIGNRGGFTAIASGQYWLRSGDSCTVPRTLEECELIVGIDVTETWGQADGACVLLGDGGRVLGVIGSPGGLQRTDGISLDALDGREVFSLCLARLCPNVRSLAFIASPRSGRLDDRSLPPEELFAREGSATKAMYGEGLAYVGRVQDDAGAFNGDAYGQNGYAGQIVNCKSLCWSRVLLPPAKPSAAVVCWMLHCDPEASGSAKFRLEATSQALDLPDMGSCKKVPLGAIATLQPRLAQLQANGRGSAGQRGEMPSGEDSWFTRAPWFSTQGPISQSSPPKGADGEEPTAELNRVLQTAGRFAQEKWKEAEREKMIAKELHQLLLASQSSLRRSRGSAQTLQYSLESWRREALLHAQSGHPEKVVALLSRLPVTGMYPDDLAGKESTGSTTVPPGPPSRQSEGQSEPGGVPASGWEDNKCRYLTVNGGFPLRSRPPATTVGDIGATDPEGEEAKEASGPDSGRRKAAGMGKTSSSPGNRGLFLSAANGRRINSEEEGQENLSAREGQEEKTEGIDMIFDMPFPFAQVEQQALKNEIVDGLGKTGADPASIAKIKINLRKGSVVAEIRGPTSSITTLRGLPLDTLELSNGVKPSKVDRFVAVKEDDTAEPPMAPRGGRAKAPEKAPDSARSAATDSARSAGQRRKVIEVQVAPEVKKLGFSFTNPKDGHLSVKTVTDGAWAYEAGVEVGDAILEINGQATKSMSVDEVKKHVGKRPLAFKFERKLPSEDKAVKTAPSTGETSRSPASPRRQGSTPRIGTPRQSPEELQKQKVELEAELKAREEKTNPESPELLDLLNMLAHIYGRLEEVDRHKELLERIIRIIQKGQKPEQQLQKASALKDLSTLYARQDDHKKRQALLEQAYEIEEREQGPDTVDTAITGARLANACGKNGDVQRQVVLLEKTLPVLERQDHPDLCAILSNLGIASASTQNHARAKECFLRALKIKETEQSQDTQRSYSQENTQVADILVGLADSHGNLKEFAEQRSCLERALSIKEQAFGPEDNRVAVTLANLGSVCRKTGDAKAATEVFERTLAIKEKQFGPDHAQVALTLANLAAAYGDLGDVPKQRELVQRALTIFERHHGPEHPHTQLAKKMLAKIDKSSSGTGGAKRAAGKVR